MIKDIVNGNGQVVVDGATLRRMSIDDSVTQSKRPIVKLPNLKLVVEETLEELEVPYFIPAGIGESADTERTLYFKGDPFLVKKTRITDYESWFQGVYGRKFNPETDKIDLTQ